jgi:ribosomal protein S18 acetylase RimI-like enzyme
MVVRKARSSDSESISLCLLLAMEEIVYKLTGEEKFQSGLAFMNYFVVREFNQYSWQNCWVVEHGGTVAAAVNVYDGARLHELRQPVIDHLRAQFKRPMTPEDETERGEHYIDSQGVLPQYRCKGIGTNLLQFLIDEYVTKRKLTLGLLVDDGNPGAKSLYLKLGFRRVGTKTLLGKDLEHLQFKSDVARS